MTLVKKFLLQYRWTIIKFAAAFVFVTGVTALIKCNYDFYNKPIGKIVEVETECMEEAVGDAEPRYLQTMTIEIMNGKYKGHRFTYYNKYLYSGFKTQEYKKGTDVFLSIKEETDTSGTEENDDGLTIKITKNKLDYYYGFIIAVFVVLVLLVSKVKGIFILLSVVLNIGIFAAGLNGFIDGRYIGAVTLALTACFIAITLLLLNGFSKKSFGAIISSLITMLIIAAIYKITLNFSEKPMFELMDYIIGNEPLEELYFSSVVLGAIGAVMDVAITINASVAEIITTAKEPTVKSIVKSIREIGYDIMGTMINVLFFTFISGGLPMFILKIKNGYALSTILNLNVIFDEIRFLIGAIGIVMAIPVSGAVAMALYKNKLVKAAHREEVKEGI